MKPVEYAWDTKEETASSESTEPFVRLNADGTLDEVVGSGSFHLEQMSAGGWWMRLDGKRVSVTVNLTARGKISATYYQELTDAAAKPAPNLDPAARQPATFIEMLAIETLNHIKAWRDSDGNEAFPHDLREQIDAILLTYELRRFNACPSDRRLTK